MRLTWVQPEDLVGHALVQARLDGVDVGETARRWQAAGGAPAPRAAGASAELSTPGLRRLAEELLDDLDERVSSYDDDEPTDLEHIARSLPDGPPQAKSVVGDLLSRIHGAWLGRAAGCVLGKPVEKIPRQGIREILQAQGRWPLDDWFTAAGLPDQIAERWPWNRRSARTSLAENIDGMPEDDDLNYPMLNLALLEDYGARLTTEQVAERWLNELPAGRVFTAERVAYRNLLLGHVPPATARIRNPFRDWIGAQIRADVFGWACPGDPWRAASLAHTDAVLSHTRNGVYGAMFVAAACAMAVASASLDEALDAGLAVVPPQSRYADAVRFARALPDRHAQWEDAVDAIEARYGDLHWVHVLGNTALLIAGLQYGHGDLGRSICLVVSGGLDTDSNGATAGSLIGGVLGADDVPSRWVEPLRNRVTSTLSGFDGIGFDELARRTVAVAGRISGRER